MYLVVLAIKVLQVHNLQDVEDVCNDKHDEGSYKNDDDQDDLDAIRKKWSKGWSFSDVIKEGSYWSP